LSNHNVMLGPHAPGDCPPLSARAIVSAIQN
jgi:hypothetical protein